MPKRTCKEATVLKMNLGILKHISKYSHWIFQDTSVWITEGNERVKPNSLGTTEETQKEVP